MHIAAAVASSREDIAAVLLLAMMAANVEASRSKLERKFRT